MIRDREGLREEEQDRRCVACGMSHGSVNQWLSCLSDEVRRQREVIKRQNAILLAMPPTTT